MPMINQIQQFLKNQRGVNTPYRFWRDTGICRPVAYQLWNNPHKLPDPRAYSRICQTYKTQISEFVLWIDEPTTDLNES